MYVKRKDTVMLLGAELTGVAPALIWHGATAALVFGGVKCLGVGAFSILKAGEAKALSCVYNKKEITSMMEMGCLNSG